MDVFSKVFPFVQTLYPILNTTITIQKNHPNLESSKFNTCAMSHNDLKFLLLTSTAIFWILCILTYKFYLAKLQLGKLLMLFCIV